jgi:hypothetical protein
LHDGVFLASVSPKLDDFRWRLVLLFLESSLGAVLLSDELALNFGGLLLDE